MRLAKDNLISLRPVDKNTMMSSTNDPQTMPSSGKQSIVRRPLQSLNVNSNKGRQGVLSGDTTVSFFRFRVRVKKQFLRNGRIESCEQFKICSRSRARESSPKYFAGWRDESWMSLNVHLWERKASWKKVPNRVPMAELTPQFQTISDTYAKHPTNPNQTMTVSTSIRYPLSNAHNRKRRPAFPLQEKLLKPKSVLNFVAAVEVAPSMSAEMSVNQDKAKDEATSYEEHLNSIFRERESMWGESRDALETEEEEDLWSLKRASPIIDEEDEEFMSYESPSKKSKVESIFWENRLSGSNTFDLSSMMVSR